RDGAIPQLNGVAPAGLTTRWQDQMLPAGPRSVSLDVVGHDWLPTIRAGATSSHPVTDHSTGQVCAIRSVETGRGPRPEPAVVNAIQGDQNAWHNGFDPLAEKVSERLERQITGQRF